MGKFTRSTLKREDISESAIFRGVAIDPQTWLPLLREMPVPTGQDTPVGCIEQYPPSDANPFFARYCWW
jgi:hypothetical protein